MESLPIKATREFFITYFNKVYKYYYEFKGKDRIITNDKNMKLIDALLSNLSYVELNSEDARSTLYTYYINASLSYFKRNFAFPPTLSRLFGKAMTTKIIKQYKEVVIKLPTTITLAEYYIRKHRIMAKYTSRKPGLFYGYPWEEIKGFTLDSPQALLGKLILHRITENKEPVVPTKELIKLIDALIFMYLGNNFLEERREQCGYPKHTGVIVTYKEINALVIIKRRLEKQLILLSYKNPIQALGYMNVHIKIGKTTASYYDTILWKKAIDQEDRDILAKLEIETGLPLQSKEQKTAFYTKLIKGGGLLRNQIKYDKEWNILKQILLQIEVPIAQARLKGIQV